MCCILASFWNTYPFLYGQEQLTFSASRYCFEKWPRLGAYYQPISNDITITNIVTNNVPSITQPPTSSQMPTPLPAPSILLSQTSTPSPIPSQRMSASPTQTPSPTSRPPIIHYQHNHQHCHQHNHQQHITIINTINNIITVNTINIIFTTPT